MSTIIQSLTRFLFLSACLAVSVRAEGDQLSLLEFVSEDALVIMHVEDIVELTEQWEASPLGTLVKDEKIRAFLKPMLEKGEVIFEEIPGGDAVPKAFEKVRGQFTGELVLACVHAPFERWISSENGDEEDVPSVEAEIAKLPHVVMLGEVGDAEAFMKLSDELMETIQEVERDSESDLKTFFEKEEAGGVECRFLQIEKEGEKPVEFFAYGEVGGRAVVGWPKSVVLETLTALKKNDLGKPAAAGGTVADFRDRFPEAAASVHLNLESGLRELFAAVENAAGSGAIDLSEMKAMGVTMESIRNSMGLDDLRSLGLGLEFDDDRLVLDSGLMFERRSGIMKVLAYEDGAVPLPDFVPPQAQSATVSRFSFQQLWSEVKKMVAGMSPQLNEQFMTTVRQLEEGFELDFEKDLINHLGKIMIQVEDLVMPDLSDPDAAAEPMQDNVMVLELKNARGFELGLDKLVAGLGMRMGLPFAEQEYLGTKMRVMGLPPNEVSFFVQGNYAFLSIGTGKMLRRVLSSMDRPDKSLWELPRVKKNIKQLEPGYCEISYVRLGKLVNGLIEMVAPVREMLGEEDIPLDFEAMPDGAYIERMLGDMFGARYIERNGYFGQAFLVPGK